MHYLYDNVSIFICQLYSMAYFALFFTSFLSDQIYKIVHYF
ncbi:hypothetical protein ROSEINA2194_03985 [Roseburia inulinivorans DSM 16841]|uniref:Uncharacterized protein n=1 Tax=Roseburia inulinivorans DSM 16841 TaxID=622312 RepID=C0FYZ5_9FIRM|nr:hypothetical protein ROSEINA2194_03985 [Roseburia inulinivorans DSM 16841]